MLTDEQVREYVERDWLLCPYCKAEHTVEMGSQFCEDMAYQKFVCWECGRTWEATYRLVSIQ
jgi:transposase-like protein